MITTPPFPSSHDFGFNHPAISFAALAPSYGDLNGNGAGFPLQRVGRTVGVTQGLEIGLQETMDPRAVAAGLPAPPTRPTVAGQSFFLRPIHLVLSHSLSVSLPPFRLRDVCRFTEQTPPACRHRLVSRRQS